MPLQATSGAASYDAFGGGAASEPVYIEDAFSCFLYSGTSSTQTITNGIDLAGDGGLVWTKMRNTGSFGNSDHWLFDTARGVEKILSTNTTSAQGATSGALQQFNANGYQLGYTGGGYYELNYTGNTYVSWTLKKQPKFFDVVTYTGNDAANRQISHSLGSTPGCIIVKKTNEAGAWYVYHRSLGDWQTNTPYTLYLNTTDSQTPTSAFKGDAPTSTTFTVDGVSGAINETGKTYVAYLFAHNAGGFGLTGTDNVISCGSYTESVGSTITLGYEPQYLLLKRTDSTSGWFVFDTMRGLSDSTGAFVYANTSGAEVDAGQLFLPQATGFKQQQGVFGAGANVIYIAIRRGPMKVPTSGTSVLALSTWTGSTGNKDLGSQTANFGTGFATFIKGRNYGQDWGQFDQLRGVRPFLSSDLTSAEINDGASTGGISVVSGGQLQLNTGSYFGGGGDGTGYNYIGYNFRRAPSFFDEVCYTGDGFGTGIKHNLGVAPELIIQKARSANQGWNVYVPSTITGGGNTCQLNTTLAFFTSSNVTNVTSTQYDTALASNGKTYVNYLFASAPGVSKVGSYTGTGVTQTINCGFTGGARFVLIKRTDSTGDWYVWDTARGMVSLSVGADPSLSLNSTAAEVNANSVYTTAGGFQVLGSPYIAVNTSGASYIFLAIA